ncbi:AAA family ATPase [Phytoactinopolyspora limicola]|uniref:AAA family ATPase n=1 Tax=Phytoactinopolyspora limicola TaxID=2715536 RepID=UPI00140D1C1D|nr:AAA family ATPase [Phytoactinopolyspora limicola]
MAKDLVWLNGTFGAGKTTTARELVAEVAGARLFDPEYVGFMLRHFITEPVQDFQDWPSWRVLAAETAHELLRHYGGPLIVPMTLLRREYADEVFTRLRGHGVAVQHVLLHVDEPELIRRIEADEVEAGARQWRLDHLGAYRGAQNWLRSEAEVVDTTPLTPSEVAKKVMTLL